MMTAKQNGRLKDIEYKVFFQPDKKTSAADKAAVGVIVFGLGMTVISYLLAAPGRTYTIFWGLIALGVFRLLYSNSKE